MSSARAGPAADLRIHVVQGEQHVTDDPGAVLTTLLGSCVAACMRDPVAGVGGMNHFLLPGGRAAGADREARRHGVHAMELLVNALLSCGARRTRRSAGRRRSARRSGGRRRTAWLPAARAARFLADEGIAHVGGSLLGEHGRKIQYWPVSGRARQSLMERESVRVFDTERRTRPALAAVENTGDVDLF